MPKVILVSTFPLPYSKIGSWTTMYRNYLESGNHNIDHIICEMPDYQFPGVRYTIVKENLWMKVRRKLHYYRIGYMDALKSVLQPDEKYVIQLVDNFNMADRIHEMLTQMGIRQNCFIQLFYHGYDPFLPAQGVSNDFYSDVDGLVLLTHDSYRSHLNYYTVFPIGVSVLYNGIDAGRFKKVDANEKTRIRQELGLSGNKIFLWCSQDRPKKGLDLILQAWRLINEKHPGNFLMVVGADRRQPVENVKFFGRIPNDDLPKYYQAADCYLFPTLCHEGFGLSLIEALNCGCHCIASGQGGVPEVLQHGKLGRLIENPNFVSEWEQAIADFITGKDDPIVLDHPIYTQEEWAKSMNDIIDIAKKSLS
ncbi:glycosyltransferase family 4 protein [Flavobacterium selenitireducens]|uniref:glycosyltransferase family 4 protein n=1 Tax=Flavobacterium selenitireducens TaxID=2722704 RepID=UPI00168BB79C|nr:glycosyltransferase family 4 protein [Flavobacterium selenitireducens]MBD3583437.1 glycosyltransferase family 4 protein [Flavobacterium selenitireducens]